MLLVLFGCGVQNGVGLDAVPDASTFGVLARDVDGVDATGKARKVAKNMYFVGPP